MNLNDMTASELRKLAARFDVTGRSTMKKAELIAALSAPEIAHVVELSVTIDQMPDDEPATVEAEAAYIEEGIERDEAADAEAGELLDAVLGEYAGPIGGEVAILRDAPGRAIVTAAYNGLTTGAEITREGKRLVLRYAKFTIKANSYEKLAKLFAQRLGFRADRIDVERSF